MIQIDKETKEKRNVEYNKKARIYPAYLSLAIPIVLGVAMGVKGMVVASVWVKALIYLLSISAISAALLFLLRFVLQIIAKFYPERVLFGIRGRFLDPLSFHNWIRGLLDPLSPLAGCLPVQSYS